MFGKEKKNQTRVTKHKSMCTREHKEQFEVCIVMRANTLPCWSSPTSRRAHRGYACACPRFLFLFPLESCICIMMAIVEVVGLQDRYRSTKKKKKYPYFNCSNKWIMALPCEWFWRAVCLAEHVHRPAPALPSQASVRVLIEADGFARGECPRRLFFSTPGAVRYSASQMTSFFCEDSQVQGTIDRPVQGTNTPTCLLLLPRREL